MRGTVKAFDAAGGWGIVVDEVGAEHWFHCTAIADGSRAIEPGTSVSFELVAGHLGRYEATDMQPA